MPGNRATAYLILDDKGFRTGLARSRRALTGWAAEAAIIGKRTQAIGRSLTRYVTLPVLAAGAASVKFAADFDTQMMQVHTSAGASLKDVETLSGSILHMKDALFGPAELAKGMYHLKSVGMSNVDALKALGTAQKAAAMTGADLEETTTALAGAWRTGIKGARTFGETMGTVNAIVGAGNMRLSDLVGAIGTGVLGTFKTAGLALLDFGAAEATLTSLGTPAAAAATRLSMAVMKMAAPTTKAKDALKGLGLGAYQLATDMRKPRGLLVALKDLAAHLKGMSKVQATATLSDIFGGARTGRAIFQLMGNLGLLSEKYDKIAAQTKTFGEKVRDYLGTPSAKWREFLSSLKATAVSFGQVLLPAVEQVGGVLQKAVGWFSGLSKSDKTLIVQLLATAAALGPLLVIVGKTVTIIATLQKVTGLASLATMGWVGLIIAVAAALVFAYLHSKRFRNIVNEVAKVLLTVGKVAVQAFALEIRVAIDAIKVIVAFVGLLIGWLRKLYSWVASTPLGKFLGAEFSVAKGAVKGLISAVQWALNVLGSLYEWAKGTTLGKTLSKIFSVAKTSVGWFIDKLKVLWDWIEKVTGRHEVLFYGRWTIKPPPAAVGHYVAPPPPPPPPRATGHALGGIITRPQLSLIGEAGPEAVIPLSRPWRSAQIMGRAGVSFNVAPGAVQISFAGAPAAGVTQATIEATIDRAFRRLAAEITRR